MIKITNHTMAEMEKQHPGIGEDISRFENALLPACSHCGSEDTAEVQCGIIGRTIYIAHATTKFKLIQNRTQSGKYFCNACNAPFDHTPKS